MGKRQGICEACGRQTESGGRGPIPKHCKHKICVRSRKNNEVLPLAVCVYCGEWFVRTSKNAKMCRRPECMSAIVHEYSVAHYAAHREERLTARREWGKRNAEKARALKRRNRRERIARMSDEEREEYGRRIAEYHRRHRRRPNRQAAERERGRRRRTLLKGGKVGKRYRDAEIYARDGGICQLCGWPVRLDVEWNDQLAPQIDHIRPVTKGGKDCADNVQLAHRICNIVKHNKMLGGRFPLRADAAARGIPAKSLEGMGCRAPSAGTQPRCNVWNPSGMKAAQCH